MKELLAIFAAIAIAIAAVIGYAIFQAVLMWSISTESFTYILTWIAFGTVVTYGLSFLFDDETITGRSYYHVISAVVYSAVIIYGIGMPAVYLTTVIVLINAWYVAKKIRTMKKEFAIEL
jgi:hypothetical protein